MKPSIIFFWLFLTFHGITMLQIAAQVPVMALPDTITTTDTIPATVAVLNNDAGEGLTITKVIQPQYGSVVFTNTACIYTPNGNATLRDVFQYQVTDNTGATDLASVLMNRTYSPGQTPLFANANVELTPNNEYKTYILLQGGAPPYTVSGSYNAVLPQPTVITMIFSLDDRYYITITDALGNILTLTNEDDIQPCLLQGISDID